MDVQTKRETLHFDVRQTKIRSDKHKDSITDVYTERRQTGMYRQRDKRADRQRNRQIDIQTGAQTDRYPLLAAIGVRLLLRTGLGFPKTVRQIMVRISLSLGYVD
jgi:hypothetical protein